MKDIEIVNVKLRVPTELYETLVYPSQRSRTFAPLVVSLCQAYLDNEYVRGYVNAALTGEDFPSMPSSNLEDAERALSELQFMNEHQASVLKSGSDMLSGTAERVSSPAASASASAASVGVESDRLSALESQVELLKSMMVDFFKGSVNSVESVDPSSEPVEAEPETMDSDDSSPVDEQVDEPLDDWGVYDWGSDSVDNDAEDDEDSGDTSAFSSFMDSLGVL